MGRGGGSDSGSSSHSSSSSETSEDRRSSKRKKREAKHASRKRKRDKKHKHKSKSHEHKKARKQHKKPNKHRGLRDLREGDPQQQAGGSSLQHYQVGDKVMYRSGKDEPDQSAVVVYFSTDVPLGPSVLYSHSHFSVFVRGSVPKRQCVSRNPRLEARATTMRAELIGHFEACMTEIYLHIDARMADYIRTHP